MPTRVPVKTTDVTDFTDTEARRFAITGDKGPAILKALGCPPRTRRISIDIDTDAVVMVTFETYASDEQMAALGRCFEADD